MLLFMTKRGVLRGIKFLQQKKIQKFESFSKK